MHRNLLLLKLTLILTISTFSLANAKAGGCEEKINSFLFALDFPNPIKESRKFNKYFTGDIEKFSNDIPLFSFQTKKKFKVTRGRTKNSRTSISEMIKLKLETKIKNRNLYMYFYEGSMKNKTGTKHIFIMSKKCRFKSYTVKKYLKNKKDYLKITSSRYCRFSPSYTPAKNIDDVMDYFNVEYHKELCNVLK